MNVECDCIYKGFDGEEHHVGLIIVSIVPRIGEQIWFTVARLGQSAWVVDEIAHWVGKGEGFAYQRIALYVIPVEGEAVVADE